LKRKWRYLKKVLDNWEGVCILKIYLVAMGGKF
jgi:hypothetical protein